MVDELAIGKARAKGIKAKRDKEILAPYFEQLRAVIAESFHQAVDDDKVIEIKYLDRALDTIEALMNRLIADGNVAEADLARLSGRVNAIN